MARNININPVGSPNEIEMADGTYTAKSYLLMLTQLASVMSLMTDSTFLNDSKLLFGKPSEYVLSVRYYPIKFDNLLQVTIDVQDLEQIIFGGKTYNNVIAYPLGRPQYTRNYRLTTMKINGTYNNFADYLTRIKIYIPYLGYRDLDTREIMYKYISVYISLDLFNGTMTAYIVKYETQADATAQTNGTLIDQVSGQIGIDIPFGSTNANDIAKNIYTNIIDFSLGGVMAFAGAQGGSDKMMMSGLKQMYGSAKNTFMQQERFNGGQAPKGSVANLTSPTSIFLTYIRPNVIPVDSAWERDNGYPLQEMKLLSTLSGYTEVREIHFNPMGEDIYDDEINEIISLLHDGVIL